jgi:hypothetical protein
MPCCSCPLSACACAGIRSTTKNPGARCAPARSISLGSRPPAVTVLLPPSCPAPARLADARSLSYPRSSWCWPCAAARRCPVPVPAASRQRPPGSPMPAASGRGPSRAHTAPCGRDRTRCRESGRPRASGPAVAALAPACRARQHAAHAAAGPAEPQPGLERVRAKVPSGLTPRTPTAAGTASRTRIAAVLSTLGVQSVRSGCTRRRHLRHRCRLPAGCTER